MSVSACRGSRQAALGGSVARWLVHVAMAVAAACMLGACTGSVAGHDPNVSADLHLPLSPADRAYLQSLPVLRVGVDPKWAPMAFVDATGHVDGISGDYLEFVARTLGVRFRVVPAQSWAQVIQLANRGEIDFVAAVSSLDGLNANFRYSKPYVSYPLVIVTRETAPFIAGADDIAGSQVAIVKDSDVARLDLSRMPKTRLLVVSSADKGLDAVASGKAFAYVGNLGVVDKLVRQKYAGVLRIAAPAGRNEDLSFALAPQYQRLLTLVDRVLASIPERERDHIQNGWLSTQFTFGVPARTLWLVLTPVAVVTIAFLSVLCIYMMRLRVEVRERRRTECQLVELTQGLPALVFQLQLDRGTRRRFSLVFANRRAYDWLRLHEPEHESVLGAFLDRLDPEARFDLERRFLRSAHSLEPVRTQRALRFADGRRMWVHLEAAPQRRRTGDIVWSGYIHDVTEAKETQMALVGAKHDAEEASRARDAFLATVSHEIRTPIAGLVSILQLLDHGRLAHDDQHLVDMARNAAEILLRILNDILDFAKSENGELALEHASISVTDIVERTAGIVAPEIEHKGLHLLVDVARDLAPYHIGDAQRLGQVLLNLLGNASKFTNYGTISLTVRAKGRESGRERLLIRVADTGIGIANEDHARLFSPFAQASNKASGRYRGTGLGLAICKRLIESMGGTISLDSAPGRGTTISIDLPLPIDASRRHVPLSRASIVRERRGGAPLPVAATPGILIVEDERINREVLKRQLAAVGWPECDCAANGVEALRALQTGHYAMVITDCAMPVMDGIALIKHVRAREAQREGAARTVLVALTANAMPQQREACLAAGAHEVLVKPVGLDELRALLGRYGMAAPLVAELDRAGIPPERQAELRGGLRQTLCTELSALQTLSLERDADHASEIVHRILGAAAWFCLDDVTEAATYLQDCLDGQQGGMQPAFARLQTAILRVTGSSAEESFTDSH